MTRPRKPKNVVAIWPVGAADKPESVLSYLHEALQHSPKGFLLFTVKKDGEIDTHLFGKGVTRYDTAWMSSVAMKLSIHGWKKDDT